MTFDQGICIIAICVINFVCSFIFLIFSYNCFDKIMNNQWHIVKKLKDIRRRLK